MGLCRHVRRPHDARLKSVWWGGDAGWVRGVAAGRTRSVLAVWFWPQAGPDPLPPPPFVCVRVFCVSPISVHTEGVLADIEEMFEITTPISVGGSISVGSSRWAAYHDEEGRDGGWSQ